MVDIRIPWDGAYFKDTIVVIGIRGGEELRYKEKREVEAVNLIDDTYQEKQNVGEWLFLFWVVKNDQRIKGHSNENAEYEQ